MHFDWNILITIGVLIFIGLWLYSKIKKQTMRETIEDIKELIKWEEINQ